MLGTLETPHTVVVARFSPRTRVAVGDSVEVHVDTARLHFFDPETGASIWDGAAPADARPAAEEGPDAGDTAGAAVPEPSGDVDEDEDR